MKQLLFIACIFSAVLTNAQTQGTIVYEETIKLEFDFEGPDGMDVKSMMPSSQTAKNQLVFNEKASLYSKVDDADESEDGTEGSFTNESGAQIKLEIKRPETTTYRDLSSGKVLENRELMTKKFLISDDGKRDWKLSQEQKEVLGYTCSKASWEDSTSTVVAWYTSKIPASIGPGVYGGLPGAILFLEVDNGKRIYEAKKIDFSEPTAGSIQKPKSGKKVTREEFMEIAEAKMQEMRDTMGAQGSGGKVMIMRGR